MKPIPPRGAHLAFAVVRLTGSAVAGLLLISACIHETDVAVQPGVVMAKSKIASSPPAYTSPTVVFNATTTATATPAPATQ